MKARAKLVVATFTAWGSTYIGVKVDHSAFDFWLNDTTLVYNKLERNEEDLVTRVGHTRVPTVDPKKCYEFVGTYKSLNAKDKEFLRQPLIERGFNIDDNIFILKELF